MLHKLLERFNFKQEQQQTIEKDIYQTKNLHKQKFIWRLSLGDLYVLHNLKWLYLTNKGFL